MVRTFSIVVLVLLFSIRFGYTTEPVEKLEVRDSLAAPSDESEDALACLQQLGWKPAQFEATLKVSDVDPSRRVIRFPSPVVTGNDKNDLVALDWYAALDTGGKVRKAPAVVVVHESGADMTVGRTVAFLFQKRGVHAFLVHLPHYGLRRSAQKPPKSDLVPLIRQAVADVRRAGDVVASLPAVQGELVALQGTSLGGFVTAIAGSLDDRFDRVFIFLAGGDVYGVLQNGRRESAKLRAALEEAGYEGERLKKLLWKVEPTRIAHRLNPSTTWLFSATYDRVVPPLSAKVLAEAAGLSDDHHVRFMANHVSGVVFLPTLLDQMLEKLGPLPVPGS